MTLPTHVAFDDEPIPALCGRPWEGPDMATIAPIDELLRDLRQFEDDHLAYVCRWREHIESIGAFVSASIDRDGSEHIGIGLPCDSQTRHRNRWVHFLCEDLKSRDGRQDMLLAALFREGHYIDNRPADPRQTTIAIRDYLRAQCRILLDPQGELTIGGEIPEAFLGGTDEKVEEVLRAARAYRDVRKRRRSEKHIKRAVRMLGRPFNGWLVLESRISPGKNRASMTGIK